MASQLPPTARFSMTGTSVTAPNGLPRAIVNTDGMIEIKALDAGLNGNLRKKDRNEAALAQRAADATARRLRVAELRGEGVDLL
jgi:hypothetical protein